MYWRRRLLVLGSIVLVIVLLVLTVRAVAGGGGGGTGAARSSTPVNSSTTTPGGATSSSTPPPSSSSGAAHSSSANHSASSSAPPATCDPKSLMVKAVVGQSSYQVGDTPLLELQVTNPGPKPCVQDLADKQVELRVYNGESRVWGSHDCQVQSGTDPRTLAVNTPVLVAITWSGLSSEPGCAGTRQRVGAGTYTLYALLAGQTGKAAQFTIG